MILRLVNLALFILMVVMNYLANALPINGQTTGALSDAYPNLFVPTGLTFSIWGVIYLMLFVFVLVQFRDSNKEMVEQIGWLFALTCLLNSLWIIAWHYQWLPLSLAIMLGILVALVAISLNIKVQPMGIIKSAFGIYLGWICIATIANVTALLVNYSWGGWGLSEQVWTMVMITIGALITMVAIVKLKNPMMGIAVIWAFIGIVIKQKGLHPAIVTAAAVAIGLVGLITILSLFKVKLLSK